ncbi:MAG: HEPN domain-containing protein [Candidatus Coatesbacteria bacterium]|nr:HEPN domain-containing protein [Candidatus Coatesbacteria bacterium]
MHSLLEPLQLVVSRLPRHKAALEPLKPAIRFLEAYYTGARHPNGPGDLSPRDFYTRDQAAEALDAADGVLKTLRRLIANPEDQSQ